MLSLAHVAGFVEQSLKAAIRMLVPGRNMAYLWHMRTTVELPDHLLTRARNQAARSGITLKEFFIEAVEQRLASGAHKTRHPPPTIGAQDAPRIGVLTAEQLDEAMFG